MRFMVLIYKELLQFFRNRGLFLFVIYLFTGDLYIAANGIDLTMKNAKFYVLDEDKSFHSREVISKFIEPWFKFEGYINDDRVVEDILMKDLAVGVILIPQKFGENIKKGRTAEVAIFINGTETSTSYLFSGYASQIFNEYAIRNSVFKTFSNMIPMVMVKDRILYNPNANSHVFMTITELFSVITLLALILPAAAITKEKENGNIEMIIISPITMKEFLLSKIVSMNLIIIAGVVLATYFVIVGPLGVPFKGSFTLFLILTICYVFTASGLSMLIASVANNMLQVSQITIMVLMPILFLSGSWTPYESMPYVFQKLTFLSPLKYYLESSFTVILKGLGIKYIFMDIMGMLVLGVPIFVMGAHFLVKRI